MVQTNFTTLQEKKQMVITFTDKPVTAWGGLILFSKYSQQIGLVEKLKSSIPFILTSPNATKPEDTMLSFIVGVLVGSKRFRHLEILRRDKIVKKLMDIKRYPTDATFTRFFRRFGQREIEEMFPKLFNWQLNSVPKREDGYTLDLDSSVFERYGKQEGAKKGYNPKKRGRPSHHPLLAVLSSANVVVHGWLRSGNTKSSRGAKEFLTETLSIIPKQIEISAIRGDSGFCDGNFLDFLESENVSKPYAIGMKFTGRLQAKTTLITTWQKVAEGIEIGEVFYQADSWNKSRRIIIIREHVPELEVARGRKLFDDPEYVYQAIITNKSGSGYEIWQFYRGRADTENRIKELKWDYGVNGFCMKKFFPTEAVFRMICFIHNLIQEFQKGLKLSGRKTLSTIRTTIFALGAILGKIGHKEVIRLSISGWQKEKFLSWLKAVFYSQKANCVAVET